MSIATKKTLSVAALLAIAFLAGVFFVTSAANLLGSDGAVGQGAQASDLASAAELSEAFEEVAEAVNPAVVQIRSTRLITQDQRRDPFQGTPFEDFFRSPNPGVPGQPFEQSGLGSGAFIRADGYIVTNNHVVAQADELEVVLFDGRTLRAEVVGTDAFSDIAVLKVEGDGFPYLALGESTELRVGQWVLAFGSPLDEALSNTVTAGIISSSGRYQGSNQALSTYIQTDAAINPGNSGGPLVNLEGEIIGINSAIATRTGGFQGIGFAIPVNIVRNSVEQLIEQGSVERGYLGILFGPVTPALARALDVPVGAAQISEIREDADGDSPAGDAGLRPGDVIVAVDGRALTTDRELISIISNRRPGDRVEVTYNREGEERTTTVTLGRRPGDPATVAQAGEAGGPPASPSAESAPAAMEELGLTLQNLTPALIQQYRLGKDVAEGVAVTDVDRDSEAYRDAELRPGDVILEVDRAPVTSVAAFQQAYRDVRPGNTFLLRVQRGGSSFLTALTKPS